MSTPEEIERKYTVTGREIGDGYFGEVYPGVENATGATVAIKQIPDYEVTFSEVDGVEVPLEAQFLKALVNVPSVIGFRDWYKMHRDVFIIMDLHESSCDLKSFLKTKVPIEEGEVKKWYKQIVEAVVACYNAGVVHFDLKPENILIDESNNRILLIDFGCGAFIKDLRPEYVIGCRFYMPPELREHHQFDPIKGTVWALGCLLVNMFDTTTDAHTKPRLTAASPHFRNDRSAECLDLVDRCFVVDPNGRASFEEILQHGWFNQN